MHQDILQELEKFSKVGTWEYRLNSRELTWSPQMHKIFGLSEGQCSLTLSFVLESIHGPDRIKWEMLLNEASILNIDNNIVIRIMNQDHEIKWIRKSAKGIFVNGELVGLRGFCQDISHEKRLQEYFDTTKDLLSE
jgi:PAS domain-containing protein